MTRGRRLAAAVGLVLLVGGLAWTAFGLPAFGHYHHRYGAVAARESLPLRRAENAVNTTAFDYRGFDTIGEEFILFVSVVSVVVLLRELGDEADHPPHRERPGATQQHSTLTRWVGSALMGPLAVIGADVVTHGQLSPGGGFQGGIILGVAVALSFVAGQYLILRRLRAIATWMDMLDAVGAGGFVMIGIAGLISVGPFLDNVLPYGHSGLLTGGIIPLANLSVGIEVAGAVLVVLAELLDQRLLSGPA
ncbi:MAG TPA: MnhB domain-containing protein [Solirubrobacteraceae bacterium]|nr:MnhB domain-containing protein [Solirubrobacteraceae bacterium]